MGVGKKASGFSQQEECNNGLPVVGSRGRARRRSRRGTVVRMQPAVSPGEGEETGEGGTNTRNLGSAGPNKNTSYGHG